MYVDLSQALVFMLVMFRMVGLLVTNPIFGRANIPMRVNAGLSFVLSVLVTTSVTFDIPPEPDFLELAVMCFKEFAVGMMASLVLRLFLSIFVIGGEVVDMQIGIGMSKVFDPGTNTSISLSSTWFNNMFILIFFATNNHLTFFRMAAGTFRIIPLGMYNFNWHFTGYLPEYFTTIMLFALKLCLPVVVTETIVSIAVGLIMKMVPSINVFIINIQFKLVIGMLVLVVMVVPFMNYFENLIIFCFEQISYVWNNMAV